MVGGLEEDDQASYLTVALLEGRRAELGLGVAKARDRLDCNRCVGADEKGIEGSKVAGDVQWGLEPPVPSVADSCPEAAKEVELCGVAKTPARWIEARVQPQANRGSVPGQIGHRKVPEESVFYPADPRVRHSRCSRNVDLAQASGQSRFP